MAVRNILVPAIVLLLNIAYGTAYNCPEDYPFPSCPRLLDEPTDTVCCVTYTDTGKDYHCCDESLAVWAIVLIVLVCLLLIAALVGICACCCGFCACLAGCCKQSTYQSV